MDLQALTQLSPDELIGSLNTSLDEGLTSSEAETRLKQYGPNQLHTKKSRSLISIFLRQFKSPLIWILVAAVGISIGTGHFIDAGVVLFVIFFNAALGTYQEAKAQKTFLALSQLTVSSVVVVREGREMLLESHTLVPGDMVILNDGDRIPADMRLLDSQGISVNESVLTGESFAVEKNHNEKCSSDTLYECGSLIWAGTYVERGTSRAVVLATGSVTRMGQLATEVADHEREVPLQKRIRRLAHLLVGIGLAALVLLFVLGLLFGRDVAELIRVAVSLLVAVVPEGLPVVSTLILSAGVYRMSREHVLVKRLESIETLGHADVIATDKTGTITRNELMVSTLWAGHEQYQISGVGYTPDGVITRDDGSSERSPVIERLIALVERSAYAQIIYDEERIKVIGDPTDAAMRVLGAKGGYNQKELRAQTPLAHEIPFDFKKKYYVTLFDQGNEKYEMVVTGAGEVLLDHATHMLDADGTVIPLDDTERAEIIRTLAEHSDDGLRMIGVAYRPHDRSEVDHDDVHDLVFVGLMGMKDAIRPSVAAALEKSRNAGMRVVMITGDHVTTARTLARDAGIFREGDTVISGVEIEKLSIEELADRLDSVSVFARVTPKHKMRIIEAYQHAGKTIAMTGDGVNDVPSLAAADLGMAMGITGTEAAKEAASIVLLEDDFGDVPRAVAEGRNIVLSMKRVITFLLATNIAELLVIMLAVVIGFDIPLTPTQIIWLNVVTDSFLIIVLSLEKASDSVLQDPHYAEKAKRFIGWDDFKQMMIITVVMTAGTLFMFFFTRWVGGTYAAATTIALITMVLLQIFKAWNVTLITKGVMRDTKLFITSLVSIALLAILFIIPGLDVVFELSLTQPWILFISLAVASTMLFVSGRSASV